MLDWMKNKIPVVSKEGVLYLVQSWACSTLLPCIHLSLQKEKEILTIWYMLSAKTLFKRQILAVGQCYLFIPDHFYFCQYEVYHQHFQWFPKKKNNSIR